MPLPTDPEDPFDALLKKPRQQIDTTRGNPINWPDSMKRAMPDAVNAASGIQRENDILDRTMATHLAQQARAKDTEARRVATEQERARKAAEVQAKKDTNVARETEFRTKGVQMFTDANGDIKPVTDANGNIRYHADKGPVEYPNGDAVQSVRDETGKTTVQDLDKGAKVGAAPNAMGRVFRQDKQSPWNDLGSVEEAMQSGDPAIREAAQKAKEGAEKIQHAAAKKGFEVSKNEIAYQQAEATKAATTAEGRRQQLQTQIEAKKVIADQRGWLGAQSAESKQAQAEVDALTTEQNQLATAPDPKQFAERQKEIGVRADAFDYSVFKNGIEGATHEIARDEIAAQRDPNAHPVIKSVQDARKKAGLEPIDFAAKDREQEKQLRESPFYGPVMEKRDAITNEATKSKENIFNLRQAAEQGDPAAAKAHDAAVAAHQAQFGEQGSAWSDLQMQSDAADELARVDGEVKREKNVKARESIPEASKLRRSTTAAQSRLDNIGDSGLPDEVFAKQQRDENAPKWAAERERLAGEMGVKPEQVDNIVDDHDLLSGDLGGKAHTLKFDGRVVVDPSLSVDPKKWEAAINATSATPEAKAKAKAERESIRDGGPGEALYQALLPSDDFRRYIDGSAADSKAAGQLVEDYLKSRDGTGMAKVQAIVAAAKGQIASMAQQIYGGAAFITGNDTMTDMMRQTTAEAARQSGVREGMGGAGTAGFLIDTAGSIIPSLAMGGALGMAGRGAVAAGMLSEGAAAAVTAAAMPAMAGMQTAGGTYADAYEAGISKGMNPDEARKSAILPAFLSGAATSVLTKVFSGGIEKMAINAGKSAAGKEAATSAFKSYFRAAVKEAVMDELPEETLDQLASGMVEKLTYNPNKTGKEILEEAAMAGLQAMIGAGLTSVASHHGERRAQWSHDIAQSGAYVEKAQKAREQFSTPILEKLGAFSEASPEAQALGVADVSTLKAEVEAADAKINEAQKAADAAQEPEKKAAALNALAEAHQERAKLVMKALDNDKVELAAEQIAAIGADQPTQEDVQAELDSLTAQAQSVGGVADFANQQRAQEIQGRIAELTGMLKTARPKAQIAQSKVIAAALVQIAKGAPIESLTAEERKLLLEKHPTDGIPRVEMVKGPDGTEQPVILATAHSRLRTIAPAAADLIGQSEREIRADILAGKRVAKNNTPTPQATTAPAAPAPTPAGAAVVGSPGSSTSPTTTPASSQPMRALTQPEISRVNAFRRMLNKQGVPDALADRVARGYVSANPNSANEAPSAHKDGIMAALEAAGGKTQAAEPDLAKRNEANKNATAALESGDAASLNTAQKEAETDEFQKALSEMEKSGPLTDERKRKLAKVVKIFTEGLKRWNKAFSSVTWTETAQGSGGAFSNGAGNLTISIADVLAEDGNGKQLSLDELIADPTRANLIIREEAIHAWMQANISKERAIKLWEEIGQKARDMTADLYHGVGQWRKVAGGSMQQIEGKAWIEMNPYNMFHEFIRFVAEGKIGAKEIAGPEQSSPTLLKRIANILKAARDFFTNVSKKLAAEGVDKDIIAEIDAAAKQCADAIQKIAGDAEASDPYLSQHVARSQQTSNRGGIGGVDGGGATNTGGKGGNPTPKPDPTAGSGGKGKGSGAGESSGGDKEKAELKARAEKAEAELAERKAKDARAMRRRQAVDASAGRLADFAQVVASVPADKQDEAKALLASAVPGDATYVVIVNQKRQPASYMALPPGIVQTSHLPNEGFRKNPNYGGENTRKYESDPTEQQKVRNIAAEGALDEGSVVTNVKSAADGPPQIAIVISADGKVAFQTAGGNGREMGMNMAGADDANRVADEWQAQAGTYGFDNLPAGYRGYRFLGVYDLRNEAQRTAYQRLVDDLNPSQGIVAGSGQRAEIDARTKISPEALSGVSLDISTSDAVAKLTELMQDADKLGLDRNLMNSILADAPNAQLYVQKLVLASAFRSPVLSTFYFDSTSFSGSATVRGLIKAATAAAVELRTKGADSVADSIARTLETITDYIRNGSNLKVAIAKAAEQQEMGEGAKVVQSIATALQSKVVYREQLKNGTMPVDSDATIEGFTSLFEDITRAVGAFDPTPDMFGTADTIEATLERALTANARKSTADVPDAPRSKAPADTGKDARRMRQLQTQQREEGITQAETRELELLEKQAGQNFMQFFDEVRKTPAFSSVTSDGKEATSAEQMPLLSKAPAADPHMDALRAHLKRAADDAEAELPQKWRDEANTGGFYTELEGFQPAPGLSRDERMIEAHFAWMIANDTEGMLAQYEELAADEFAASGYVGADLARNLYPEYAKSKRLRLALDRATISPTGWLMMRRAWPKALADTNPDHTAVLLLAGGMASGKTTAAQQGDDVGGSSLLAGVADRVFYGYGALKWSIEEVQKAGKTPVARFVYRPFEKAAEGAILRAIKSGRPVHGLGAAHYNAQQAFLRAHSEFAASGVSFAVYLNDGGIADIRSTVVDALAARAYGPTGDERRKQSTEAERARSESASQKGVGKYDERGRDGNVSQGSSEERRKTTEGLVVQPAPLGELSGTEEQRIAQLEAYYRRAIESARDHGIRVTRDNGVIEIHKLDAAEVSALTHGHIGDISDAPMAKRAVADPNQGGFDFGASPSVATPQNLFANNPVTNTAPNRKDNHANKPTTKPRPNNDVIGWDHDDLFVAGLQANHQQPGKTPSVDSGKPQTRPGLGDDVTPGRPEGGGVVGTGDGVGGRGTGVLGANLEGGSGANEGGVSGALGTAGSGTAANQHGLIPRPSVGSPDRNAVIDPTRNYAPKQGKARFAANMDAIRLMRKLEAEKRNATTEEKETLLAYTGWGWMKEAFNKVRGERWKQKNDRIRAVWESANRTYEAAKGTHREYYAINPGPWEAYRDREMEATNYTADDRTLASWAKNYLPSYEQLRAELSNEEFDAAAKSVRNAHYTDVPVIGAMWGLVERLGFKGGKATEPGGGIGHFIGAQPDGSANRTTWNAVELDGVTARILAHLYPEANVNGTDAAAGRTVEGQGFQQAKIPNNSQDLFISNVPFAKEGPAQSEKEFGKQFNLHNYFFARAFAKTKPGGLVVFITSNSTMDNNLDQRKALAAMGDLVGAIRLPNTAFKANAGTEVTTDILVFRKPDGKTPGFTPQDWIFTRQMGTAEVTAKRPEGQGVLDWLKSQPNGWVPVDPVVAEAFAAWRIGKHPASGQKAQALMQAIRDTGEMWKLQFIAPVVANEYFAAHPEHALGTHTLQGNMYGANEYSLAPHAGQDLIAQMNAAIASFPENIAGSTSADTGDETSRTAALTDRAGNYIERNDEIFEVGPEGLTAPDWAKTPSKAGLFREWNRLREAYNTLIALELSNDSQDADIESARADLNRIYDGLRFRHHALAQVKRNKFAFLGTDPDYIPLQCLEVVTQDMGKDGKPVFRYDKADIFTKRQIQRIEMPTTADTLEEAVLFSMTKNGFLHPPYVAELLNISESEATARLLESKLSFINPSTGLIEVADSYLSGNVSRKLDEALEAGKDDPRYRANIEALQSVQPPWQSIAALHPNLRANWVPAEVIQSFAENALGLTAVVVHRAAGATQFDGHDGGNTDSKFTGGGMDAAAILSHIIGDKRIIVKVKERQNDGSTKSVVDSGATSAANAAREAIETAFDEYVKTTGDTITIGEEQTAVTEATEKAFNKNVGGWVPPTFNGDWITLPGQSGEIYLDRGFRKSVLARFLTQGYGMMAHGVGSGKTLTQVALVMELRRLGKAKKPVIVVEKSTIGQFASSFRRAYPQAKLLVAGENNFGPKDRAKFLGMMQAGDWDAIIMTRPQVTKIPHDESALADFIVEKLSELNDAFIAAEEGSKSQSHIQAQMDKLEEMIRKMGDALRENSDFEGVTWEKLGVDAIVVDEAHNFKNTFVQTNKENVKNLPSGQFAQQAISMELKTANVRNRNAGKGVFFATGTPVSNAMHEAWVMIRYIAPHILKENGVDTFDQFADTYGQTVVSPEANWGGEVKDVTRFAKFIHGQPLIAMIRSVFDVAMGNAKLGLDVPQVRNGQPELRILPQTPPMEIVNDWIVNSVARTWTETFGEKDENGMVITPGMDGLRDYIEENPWVTAVPIMTMQAGIAAALDPRMLHDKAEDHPGSKVNTAVREILDRYNNPDLAEKRTTQVVFSDLRNSFNMDYLEEFTGVNPFSDLGPNERTFDLYEDIAKKLIAGGMKPSEVGWMESGMTDEKKEAFFAKVNSGEIRVVIGGEGISTGVNIQERLGHAYHLMPPRNFKPAQQEQRNGRIIRQGNLWAEWGHNAFVDAAERATGQKFAGKSAFKRRAAAEKYLAELPPRGAFADYPGMHRRTKAKDAADAAAKKYHVVITEFGMEKSLDSAVYSMMSAKQGFIGQILSGSAGAEFEDPTDSIQMSMAEMAAQTIGDPRLIRKIEIERELKKLKIERAGWVSKRAELVGAEKTLDATLPLDRKNIVELERLQREMGDMFEKREKDAEGRPQQALYEMGDGTRFDPEAKREKDAPKDGIYASINRYMMNLWAGRKGNAQTVSGEIKINGVPIKIEVEDILGGGDEGMPGSFKLVGSTFAFRGAQSLIAKLHRIVDRIPEETARLRSSVDIGEKRLAKARESLEGYPATFEKEAQLQKLTEELQDVKRGITAATQARNAARREAHNPTPAPVAQAADAPQNKAPVADTGSVQDLVTGNIGLAYNIADGFGNIAGSEKDDRRSEARRALINAARAYDPAKGRFSAFAGTVIRNALRDYSDKQGGYAKRNLTTLDAPLGEDGEDTAKDMLAGSGDVASEAQSDEMRQSVRDAIAALPPKLADVVNGIGRGDTYESIGARQGISKQGVGKKAIVALRLMRAHLQGKGVRAVDDLIRSKAPVADNFTVIRPSLRGAAYISHENGVYADRLEVGDVIEIQPGVKKQVSYTTQKFRRDQTTVKAIRSGYEGRDYWEYRSGTNSPIWIEVDNGAYGFTTIGNQRYKRERTNTNLRRQEAASNQGGTADSKGAAVFGKEAAPVGDIEFEDGAIIRSKRPVADENPDDEIARLYRIAKSEEPGKRTIGRPDLSLGALDELVMAVDEWRKTHADKQSHKQWEDDAEKMLATDYAGTKARIIAAGLRGEQLSSTEVKAAMQIVVKEVQRAAADPDNDALQSEVQHLVSAYRDARAEQARGLAAGRDPLKSPADRHREFLAKIIYQPPADVQKKLDEAKTPEEKKKILTEDGKRIARIQKALADMGITFDDIFSGEVELQLKNRKIVENELKAAKGKDADILKAFQDKRSFAVVAAELKVSEAEVKRVVAEAAKRIRDRHFGKFQKGATMSNVIKSAAPIDAAEAEFAKFMDSLGLTEQEPQKNKGGRPKKPKGRPFDINDPVAVVRIARTIQAVDSGVLDMAMEWWMNNILSGPATHSANIAGNAVSTAWDMTVQRGAEMLVNMAFRRKNDAQLGEAKYLLRGILPGIQRARQMAEMAWTAEYDFTEHVMLGAPVDLQDISSKIVGRRAIPGTLGRIVRMPGRALMYADSFFKGLIAQMEVGAHAYRIAKAEGLKEDALEARIKELVDQPGSVAWYSAVEKAKELTFQQDLKKWGDTHNPAEAIARAMQDASGSVPPLRFIIPFIRTPFNIMRAGLRKTPLGSIPLAWDVLSYATATGKNWISRIAGNKVETNPELPADFVKGFAEQSIAWTILAMIWGAIQGDDDDDKKQILITGSSPRTEATRGERELQKRAYGGDYMIRIGGRGGVTFNFARYEPAATVLGTMADAVRSMKRNTDSGDKMNALWGYTMAQVESKSFLRGISDMMAATRDSADVKSGIANTFAQALVPNIIRQPLRNLDEYERDGKGGGFWHTLLPSGANAETKRDVFGAQVEKTGNGLSRILVTPSTKTETTLQPADRLLLRWNTLNPTEKYAPQTPGRTYRDPKTGKDVEMSAAQFADYTRRAGSLAKTMLAGKVTERQINNPTEKDVDAIKQVFTDARRTVREQMFGKKKTMVDMMWK